MMTNVENPRNIETLPELGIELRAALESAKEAVKNPIWRPLDCG